jgi:hypothetical protein
MFAQNHGNHKYNYEKQFAQMKLSLGQVKGLHTRNKEGKLEGLPLIYEMMKSKHKDCEAVTKFKEMLGDQLNFEDKKPAENMECTPPPSDEEEGMD